MGSEAATKSREQKRAANTQELMSNIMTGGEISKKREAQLQEAANYGRGVNFATSSGSVGNLTQRDGSPVAITGAKATDYTGNIVANAPTFGELVRDAGRAVFGGQAKDPEYLRNMNSAPGKKTTDYMQYTPKPKKEKGIVPAMVEAGGTPFMMAMKAITGNKNKKEAPITMDQKYNKGVKSFANLLSGSATKNRNKLIR